MDKTEVIDPRDKKFKEFFPWLIVFVILFFVTLASLTWTINVINQAISCEIEPNIWCSNNWVCTKACNNSLDPNGDPVSSCFNTTQGVAECLYGPNSSTSTLCFNPSSDNQPVCNCPNVLSGTPNCLTNCTDDLNSLSSTATCCCSKNIPGCNCPS